MNETTHPKTYRELEEIYTFSGRKDISSFNIAEKRLIAETLFDEDPDLYLEIMIMADVRKAIVGVVEGVITHFDLTSTLVDTLFDRCADALEGMYSNFNGEASDWMKDIDERLAELKKELKYLEV